MQSCSKAPLTFADGHVFASLHSSLLIDLWGFPLSTHGNNGEMWNKMQFNLQLCELMLALLPSASYACIPAWGGRGFSDCTLSKGLICENTYANVKGHEILEY